MGSDAEEDDADVTSYAEMEEGFLKEKHRLYLAGEEEYTGQQERNKRQEIRDCTRNAFLEFIALNVGMEPKDRKIIFGKMVEEDWEETIEKVSRGEGIRADTRENRLRGAIAAIEFIYKGMIDGGINPEKVLDHVRENVGMLELTEERIEEVMSKIESGEKLTPNDRELMKHQVAKDTEAFREQIGSLDIDVESILHSVVANAELGNQTTLSAGESFAVLGYLLENPERAVDYQRLPQFLHGDVRTIVQGNLRWY